MPNRAARKPRSAVNLQMILTRKGGPHKDRRREDTNRRRTSRQLEQEAT